MLTQKDNVQICQRGWRLYSKNQISNALSTSAKLRGLSYFDQIKKLLALGPKRFSEPDRLLKLVISSIQFV